MTDGADFEKTVLETRRDLAHLYSNLSLQHAGFTIALLLAFIAVLTNYDKLQALTSYSLSVFYALFLALAILGFFEFGKAAFWSLMATVIVYRGPPKHDAKADMMSELVDYYVGEARGKNEYAYRVAFSPVIVVLPLAAIGGALGFAIGLVQTSAVPTFGWILEILGLALALVAAGIQLNAQIYSGMARLIDRKGWKATKAKKELDEKRSLGEDEGTKALLQIASADPLLEGLDVGQFKKKRSIIVSGGSKSNSYVVVQREEEKPGETSSPIYEWSTFQLMYNSGIQRRQTRAAVLILTLSVVLQFLAWILTT